MPPFSPQFNTSDTRNQLLEMILASQHQNSGDTNKILEMILQKSADLSTQQLTEVLVMLQDKNNAKLEEIANGLKPVSKAANFVNGFLESIKGDKGDPGYNPVKGKDYFTLEEISQFKKEITPIKGKDYFDGKDGYTPQKGKDYWTESEINKVISYIQSKIRTPKDGKDANEPRIVKEVLDKIAKPKDADEILIVNKVLARIPKVESDTAKQIIAKIKGLISYSDIKDAPEFRMGGTRPDSISLTEAMALLGGVETPSGTRNGVNKVFTVLHTPKFITFNGQTWYEGAGYSIVGLTVTLDIAPNAITDPSPDIIRSHW